MPVRIVLLIPAAHVSAWQADGSNWAQDHGGEQSANTAAQPVRVG